MRTDCPNYDHTKLTASMDRILSNVLALGFVRPTDFFLLQNWTIIAPPQKSPPSASYGVNRACLVRRQRYVRPGYLSKSITGPVLPHQGRVHFGPNKNLQIAHIPVDAPARTLGAQKNSANKFMEVSSHAYINFFSLLP